LLETPIDAIPTDDMVVNIMSDMWNACSEVVEGCDACSDNAAYLARVLDCLENIPCKLPKAHKTAVGDEIQSATPYKWNPSRKGSDRNVKIAYLLQNWLW
jgi:hypothetical protein